MPEGNRKQGEPWVLTVKPTGTRSEAEVAAARARRLLVNWLQQGAEMTAEERSQCP